LKLEHIKDCIGPATAKVEELKVQDCSIKLAVADEQHIENDGNW